MSLLICFSVFSLSFLFGAGIRAPYKVSLYNTAEIKNPGNPGLIYYAAPFHALLLAGFGAAGSLNRLHAWRTLRA